MIYPRNIQEKLGFDQILELCAKRCETERGGELFSLVKWMNDPNLIIQRLHQAKEMMEIVEKSALNILLPIDFTVDKEAANVIGFYYTEEELVHFIDLLRSIVQIKEFFKDKEDSYPELHPLFHLSGVDLALLEQLEFILDPDGQLKSNASPALQKLNSKIKSVERGILKQSESLFQKNKEKGYLAETELSIKNGRLVLPVLSEHKRKVDGLLVDQSSAGKISYIEPLSLVNLNNDLSELYLQKKQEIIRILREITQEILPNLSAIERSMQRLALFDMIRAKARTALDHSWCVPALDTSEHDLKKAVHPLLKIHLDQEKKKVVPLNVSLSADKRLVVISGPNAGGKSVALKTMGLLQYMLQSGFPVPVKADSSFMFFENIFVDIGDDQSIESDLSTYSSHLTAAKHIVNFSNEGTMVLMDEIGTGTDPMFGGPMAEAILEEIHAKGAYGIITTHFSNIKSKAKSLKHAVNAAMLFDTKHLKPLYTLEVGQAGSSFAYEVARNIGLNKRIIAKAKKYTNTKQYDLDALLAEVQEQKKLLDERIAEIEEKEKKADHFEKEYKELKEQLEAQRKTILDQAKKEAEALIRSSNKKIEETIRTIKESAADKNKTRQVRKKLEQSKSKLKVEERKPVELKVGDRVQIIDTESVGEIVEIKKDRAELIVGSVKTKVKLDRLQKVGSAQKKKVTRYISNSSFAERQQDFSSELDVRGMRTEEAIKKVDDWLDSAIILGFQNLRLIHGKGHGILKKQIREYLKGNPAIVSMNFERVDLGGDGVSLIELK